MCDEWEDRAAARGCVGGGCRVDSFAFYLMQVRVRVRVGPAPNPNPNLQQVRVRVRVSPDPNPIANPNPNPNPNPFYLIQADVVPFGHDAPADAPPAADDSALHPRAARLAAGYTAGVWAGYLPEYGVVRKRRIVTFSCLERKVLEVTR